MEVEVTERPPVTEGQLRESARLIGRTPLVPIRALPTGPGVNILAKLEWLQLGGSVKARPAFRMIEEAIKAGELYQGKQLLDATSGNTGLAYAAICARLGISLTLCVPENASKERKKMLKALGVDLRLTSPLEGTDGAQQQAKELFDSRPERYFYADQYSNDNNWQAHYQGTALELWHQTQGQLTHFVAGLGTSGTFTGVSKRLRELNPSIQCIALQPDRPMHILEGWKHMETARNPRFYNPSLANETLEIDSDAVDAIIKKVARTDGLFISPSAAANLLGTAKVAERLESGTIVTLLADDGSKYGDFYEQIFN